jgi:hypothetical protein
MIDGRKVIAFTPSGRERYMEILRSYVEREHAHGLIDEWVVFNNSYTISDDAYTRALASRASWIKVLSDQMPVSMRRSPTIYRFYHYLTDTNAIYVRLDDDIVFVGPHTVEHIVRHKTAHPTLFLVFPTILNNTRMSYWLQQAGLLPFEWNTLTDHFLEPTAWRDPYFAASIHRRALTVINSGAPDELDRFSLPEHVTTGRSSDGVPNNRISVNCFAIDGRDMAACNVPWDEEGYLSHHRPDQLRRFNGIAPGAVVCHFAYHPQTVEMEKTGMLEEYARVAARYPVR